MIIGKHENHAIGGVNLARDHFLDELYIFLLAI